MYLKIKFILKLLVATFILLIFLILLKDTIAVLYCNFFHSFDDYCYVGLPLFHKNWCKIKINNMNEYFTYCELK